MPQSRANWGIPSMATARCQADIASRAAANAFNLTCPSHPIRHAMAQSRTRYSQRTQGTYVPGSPGKYAPLDSGPRSGIERVQLTQRRFFGRCRRCSETNPEETAGDKRSNGRPEPDVEP